MKKCVFAGTFDPPTIGHKKVIEASLKIFDEVVVAVMINGQKTPLLTVDERVALLEKMYKNEKNVRICPFEGAAVDILERENTPFYVRGVRNTVDFEYENANYFASKKLKKDLITVYIPAEPEDICVSSTMVKNFIKFKKDYLQYIPKEIAPEIKKILENRDV